MTQEITPSHFKANYRLPEGVRVVCAFPGTGKTQLSKQSMAFVDFDWPEQQDDTEGYLNRIRAALKIPALTVMVPSWPWLRYALRDEGIPYALFYPSRDLFADYSKRYRDRAGGREFTQAQWVEMWLSCESDLTLHKVEMRRSQAYLADYFLWGYENCE